MARMIWLLLPATFALGAGCGGSVSDDLSHSNGGAAGAKGGDGGSAGTSMIDCTTLDEPACATQNTCVSLWRNDRIAELAGPPPPATGGAMEDPCCIGCEQPQCVTCHQQRFVGCRLRASACKQTDSELCGYLESGACGED